MRDLVSISLKIAAGPSNQQSLLSTAFLESLLLLLCHAFAFLTFSSALLSANPVALMPRVELRTHVIPHAVSLIGTATTVLTQDRPRRSAARPEVIFFNVRQVRRGQPRW